MLTIHINRESVQAMLRDTYNRMGQANSADEHAAYLKLRDALSAVDAHLAGMEPKAPASGCSNCSGCANGAAIGASVGVHETPMPQPERSGPAGDAFYLVWNAGRGFEGGAQDPHAHSHHAQREADRLARKHPGEPMYVLRAESKHVVPETPVERTKLVDDIPF